jgi:tRNA dimethylallyltransferase
MRGMALRPLLAICGTTGVGKSNLAIELALSLNQPSKNLCWKGARIINADAMQVYTGMDVITNKVPLAERQGIEHLLMDIREPGDQYIVGEWVQDAIQAVRDITSSTLVLPNSNVSKIDETHQRNQIPIVVGGTAYWIQHLIFPNRLSSKLGDTSQSVTSPPSSSLEDSIGSLPPELLDLFNAIPDKFAAPTDKKAALSLHQLLSYLDPAVSARWHWRDTRKVLRSLSIIKETGRRNSEIISEQADIPSKPRWVTCYST